MAGRSLSAAGSGGAAESQIPARFSSVRIPPATAGRRFDFPSRLSPYVPAPVLVPAQIRFTFSVPPALREREPLRCAREPFGSASR